jgi:hypothetical protein
LATWLNRFGKEAARFWAHDRSMFRPLLIIGLVILTAFPAAASGKKKKEGEEEGKTVGQYVDLSAVALPIVANGKLVNYVFTSVRVVLANGANTSKVREREPYFRDALVRAAHRTPFNSGTDYMSVDAVKLQASLFRDAVRIAGAQNIKAVTVLSQTPKTRAGLPKIGGRASGGVINP